MKYINPKSVIIGIITLAFGLVVVLGIGKVWANQTTTVSGKVVLMDWQMKQMDELAASREILQVHPKARIFLVSQYEKETTHRVNSSVRRQSATHYAGISDQLF